MPHHPAVAITILYISSQYMQTPDLISSPTAHPSRSIDGSWTRATLGAVELAITIASRFIALM